MIELENAQIEPVEELESYGKYEASPLPAALLRRGGVSPGRDR